MSVFKSYFSGIKEATLRPKMVLVLWLFNFLFGFIEYFLYSNLFSQTVGRSTLSCTFLKKFDFGIMSEILVHKGSVLQMLFRVEILLIFAFFFVILFLNGGILWTLIQSRKNKPEKEKKRFCGVFFQGAGQYFGRFFRLAIYSIPIWIVAGILVAFVALIGRSFSADGSNEAAIFYTVLITAGVSLFLLFLIRMILDYARIRIVVEDSNKVFSPLVQSVIFVFKKFWKTIALYYLLLLTGIILAGIILILEMRLTIDSIEMVFLTFGIAQIFILARSWTWIAFQAGQLEFYSREQKQVEEEASPPLTETQPLPEIDDSSDRA